MEDVHPLAFLFLLPFLGVFVYAAWHEYSRFRTEGKSTYGLTYDPETNTTFVGAIPEREDSYDPEEFDPVVTDQLDEAAAADDGPEDETGGEDGDTRDRDRQRQNRQIEDDT